MIPIWDSSGLRGIPETSAWITALTMPQLMAEAKKRQLKVGLPNLKNQPDSRLVPDDTDREDTQPDPSLRSRQAAAEIADVSQQTIQRAWEVTKADPELAKVARENKIAPSTARRALDDPELREELLAGRDGRKPGVRRDHKPKEERVEQIRELAAKGHHDTQIASQLGISAERVGSGTV